MTKLFLSPQNISSHKNDKSGLNPEARYLMLEEALKEYPDFYIDRFDLERGGVSYTIHTIDHIYENYRFDGKPGFVIGDDLLPGFKKMEKCGRTS